MPHRNIKAELVLQSVNPRGKKITTYKLTYPRFIHAEIMTHRVFSRNAASSRAIPSKKIIEAIVDFPALPEWWGANQKGMQAKKELSPKKKKKALFLWKMSRYPAIWTVKFLTTLGLHKQIANRLLEPWFHITTLVTSTEWDNFFFQRAHPDAQPEFQVLAYRMLDAYLKATPQKLEVGEWHIPYAPEEGGSIGRQLVCSVANAARTSYTKLGSRQDYEEQEKLYNKLLPVWHRSPFEHQAMAIGRDQDGLYPSNFRGGWAQNRSIIESKEEKPRIDLEEILSKKPRNIII